MRIIDVHTHPIFSDRGRTEADLRRIIAHGRAQGIVRMVALGDVLFYGATPNAAQLAKLNDANGRLQRNHPDYFVAFCYLNPTLGERAVMRETERCVTRYGTRGIKLEIANNAAEPCMRHVAKAARTFHLPVLQHSWSTTNIRDRKHQSDPEDTAQFAQRHPDVPVIMAHLVGCGFRGVLAVKALPNVFVDTSGAFPEEGLIEYAVEHLGADRVLYGSDLPIRENAVKIGSILGAGIPAEAKRKIFHDNTARLLHLN
ncbi:MAG: amidohydrolase family protein [Opitutales bacterium]